MSLKNKKYKEDNLKFLDEYRQREDVNEFDNGVLYRVITKGTGAKPSPKSSVRVHYKGTLIDGTQFDSTFDDRRPVSFKLSHLIEGWKTALQEMQVGAHWEIVLPYYLGYGTRNEGIIKAYSTLIFEIQLLGVK